MKTKHFKMIEPYRKLQSYWDILLLLKYKVVCLMNEEKHESAI